MSRKAYLMCEILTALVTIVAACCAGYIVLFVQPACEYTVEARIRLRELSNARNDYPEIQKRIIWEIHPGVLLLGKDICPTIARLP